MYRKAEEDTRYVSGTEKVKTKRKDRKKQEVKTMIERPPSPLEANVKKHSLILLYIV